MNLNPFMASLRRHRRPGDESGFTLIELLVVITVLGILAGVVIFAVNGLGDKGTSAANASDETILRTAEEAYCAKNGVYGTFADLRSGGFLASNPGYNGVVKTSTGACGGTGFVIGSSTYQPNGTDRVLAASNNTPGFSYLASSYAAQSGNSISFLFGKSSDLATIANGQSNSAGSPTATDVLFASADEANVNKVYAATGTKKTGALGDGNCTTTCNGVADTKTLYAIGRLAIVSCAAGSKTLPVTGASSSCPVSSRLATDLANPACGVSDAANALTTADVTALLACDSTLTLSIADPGSGCVSALGSTTSVPSAPYGCAAQQALFQPTSAGGGGLTSYPSNITGPGSTRNVTQALNVLRTGAADIAMVPLSFEESPAGNDTNNWSIVPDGGAGTTGAALHDPIKQWAIVLNNADKAVGQSFLSYLTSATGQSVLAQFGYLPIS